MSVPENDSPNPEILPDKKTGSGTRLVIVVLLLLAAGGYFLYSNPGKPPQTPAPPKSTEQLTKDAIRPPSTPDVAVPEPVTIPWASQEAVVEDSPPPPELPPYDQANAFLRTELGLAEWQALNLNKQTLPALDNKHFLQRGIAFLDGLSRGVVLDKLLPFARPASRFVVHGHGETLSMSYLRRP